MTFFFIKPLFQNFKDRLLLPFYFLLVYLQSRMLFPGSLSRVPGSLFSSSLNCLNMKKVLYTLLLYVAVCSSNAVAGSKMDRYMFVADSLFANNEFEDAFRVYGLAMKEDINNPDVFLHAAKCAFILGHSPIAESYYSLCLQKGGKATDVISGVSSSFCKDAGKDCLLSTLDVIARKHPKKEPDMLLILARHFFSEKDYKSALHFARKCVPSDESCKILAISLFQTGDIDNAAPLFESINKNGADFDAAIFEGNLHLVNARNIINDCKDTIPKEAARNELMLAKFNLTKAYILRNSDYIKVQLREIDKLTNLISEPK